MNRAVKDLRAFEFRPDFTGPKRPKPSTVTLGAAELAVMLEEARNDGAQSVRSERLDQEAERMDLIASDLSTALAELVGIAHHLESLGLEERQVDSLKTRINTACARILDGQGDFFDSLDDLAS